MTSISFGLLDKLASSGIRRIIHFMPTKRMNWRHIYLIRNALKLTYGNLVLKNVSGGYTPGPPPSGEPRLTRRGRDASDAGEGEGLDPQLSNRGCAPGWLPKRHWVRIRRHGCNQSGSASAFHRRQKLRSMRFEPSSQVCSLAKVSWNSVSRKHSTLSVPMKCCELYMTRCRNYASIYICYATSSLLDFGADLLLSDEGFQQDDPLCPLLFCASSMKMACSMTSKFNC